MTTSIQLIPNKQIVFGKKLGEGGFGIVYKGSWQSEEVAIKTLRMTKLSSDLEEEFVREAQAMAKLNSPRIIRLFGICREPGAYAMIMEFMPKGDLYQLLSEKKNALPWTKRWQLATDIGEGLAYLHANNILHRDLKSLNILLDHNLRAKITDFGLAALKQHSSSMYTESSKGSVAWMAPELFTRKTKLTPASDVYAYGMILWEIAARQIPFLDAPNQQIIPTWIKEGEREDIPEDCPKPYAQLIESCWKADPEERPTAAKVLEALNLAKPQPVSNTQKTSQTTLVKQTSDVEPKQQEHPGKADYKAGLNLYIRSQYQQAIPHLEKAAEAGYPPAFIRLNTIFSLGGNGIKTQTQTQTQTAEKLKKKIIESISWFKKMKDDVDAQESLGYCYGNGYGVERNDEKSIKYYTLAAKEGHPEAQCYIGNAYAHEYSMQFYGVDQNYAKGIKYLRRARAQGHVEASYQLGRLYYDGCGLKQNFPQAVFYYMEAAKQGHDFAQANLATCYRYGKGVQVNYSLATKYYQLAINQGREMASNTAKDLLSDFREEIEREKKRSEGGCVVS